jgi:hypothetical protein
MGVMACNRRGCDQIMCSSLINGQYVCDDCLKQLNAIKVKTISKIEKVFMNSFSDEDIVVKVIREG